MTMKVLFICHGNICRSIAAELLFLDAIKKQGREGEFIVDSAATSDEEIGNPIYPPMKRELMRRGIALNDHRARHIEQRDCDGFDHIYYMDEENRRSLQRMFDDPQHKIKPVYAYTPSIREIEDPWYTGRFDKVVDELISCIADILERI